MGCQVKGYQGLSRAIKGSKKSVQMQICTAAWVCPSVPSEFSCKASQVFISRVGNFWPAPTKSFAAASRSYLAATNKGVDPFGPALSWEEFVSWTSTMRKGNGPRKLYSNCCPLMSRVIRKLVYCACAFWAIHLSKFPEIATWYTYHKKCSRVSRVQQNITAQMNTHQSNNIHKQGV